MAFVMLWAYFNFSQFLIIWSANLAEETPWYVHRLGHGWQAIGLLLVIFHFALPFALLLSRAVKRNPILLAALAGGIIVMRVVDLFWIIGPQAHGAELAVHWLDVVAPVALGGVWLAVYARELANRPLLPLGDPELGAALEHQGAH